MAEETQSFKSNESVILKFDYKSPFELADLGSSLIGLSELWSQFQAISASEDSHYEQTKFYVVEIRRGSIIAELVPLVPQIALLPIITNFNSVAVFVEKVKKIGDFFAGNSKSKPNVDDSALKNFVQFAQPVAATPETEASLTACQIKGNDNIQIINYNFGSNEAAAATLRIQQELARRKSPQPNVYQQQLFYFYQARNSLKAKSGDLGKVESISSKPVKVWFSSEEAKKVMLKNPFNRAYLVDLEVQTVRGEATLYKISRVHQSVPLPKAKSPSRKQKSRKK